MQVLMVASECAPFVKTGGLADVVGALPQALADAGVQTRVLLPAYPALFPYLPQGEEVARWDDLPGGPARVVAVTVERVALLLLDAPQLYDRPGGPYVDADGKDWTDNAARFASLAMAGARIGMAGVAGFAPDVLHAHDWQAALAPVYLKMAGADLPSVLTIHNIAFQGRFGPQMLGPLGLDPTWYHPDGLEFYGDLSFLKGGLVYADRITTVSPKYAREILTAEFGMGLEGVLQARGAALSGILNGIDTSVWDPANDPALPRGYDARSLGRKKLARQEVAARLDLEPDHAGPLFCVISRLTEQKGLDALLEAVPYLVDRGGQLAVLGSGDRGLEDGFRAAAVAHPGRVGVQIGYDEAFSHILQAGSDAILIPSRFEPCGLTQLYALRYGTLPVVARTGGLADTVIDANPAALAAGAATGVMMGGASPTALRGAIDRVMELYADRETWTRMQRAAMRQPVGWERSAQAYAALYRDITA
jgi:starch synthase